MPIHSSTITDISSNKMPQSYYRFDGTDDYISMGDVAQVEGLEKMTIAMMVNPSLLGQDDGFIGKGNSGSSRFFMSILNAQGGAVCGVGNGSSSYGYTANGVITVDNWQHIVMVFDGTGADNAAKTKFYHNGVEHSLTFTGTQATTTPSNALGLEIGREYALAARSLQGQVADCKIYNTALTATEVKELSNGGSIPFKYTDVNSTDIITNGTFGATTGWVDNNAQVAITTGSPGYIGFTGSGWGELSQAVGIVHGKIYRAKFDITNGDGTANHAFYSNSTAYYMTEIESSSSWRTFQNQANGTYTVDFESKRSGDLILAFHQQGGAFRFTNFSMIQIGVIADYDGSSASSTTWYDKSGNSLDGTIYGATVENEPGALTATNSVRIDDPGGKLEIRNTYTPYNIASMVFENWYNGAEALRIYTGDGNYWFLTDSGEIAFNHGMSVNRGLQLTSAGRVGIGTTSPADRLHISGGNLLLDHTNEIRMKDVNGSVRTTHRIAGNDVEYGWSSGGAVKFMGGSSYTERMRIHTNGRLGIGNIAPDSLLHVGKSDTNPSFVTITHENSGGQGGLHIDAFGSATLSLLSNWTGSTINGVPTSAFGIGTPHNYPVVFTTNGAERVRIANSTGLVTIAQGLTVTGATTLSGGLVVGKVIGAYNSTGGGIIRFFADDNVAVMKLGDEAGIYAGYATSFASYTPPVGAELLLRGIDGICLGVSRAGAKIGLRVASDGNVGIGTTAPNNPLHISHSLPRIYLTDNTSSGTGYLELDGTTMKLANGSTNGKLMLQTNNNRVEYIYINGTAFYSESFNLLNGTQYDFEVTVPDEGGYGNSFFIIAGYNHYYNASYGAHKVAFMSSRSTNMSTMIDLGDQNSAGGGAWEFSKATATTLRIRKTAGSYAGAGSGFITVFFRNAIG